jgi:EF-P beta-lysylation protein EpmB
LFLLFPGKKWSRQPAGLSQTMAILTVPDPPVRTSFTTGSWQAAMKAAVRDPRRLCRLLELPTEADEAAARAAEQFPLFAPLEYIARMRPGDLHDPLLRQVLPLADELAEVPGFQTDPVHDEAARWQPGLLQKYQARMLMVTTGTCAVHCRYCFRRHYPYAESPRSPADWEPAIARIAADPSLDEVILSGGDPLTLVDASLAELVERLERVPHLRRLRIHTRLPIVIPQRVTNDLLRLLTRSRLTAIVVIHANHPHEIDAAVAGGLAALADTGIPLLNQAVLLRGVNDDADVLVELSRRLVNLRVMPYYLHQLDRVAGAAHFETPVSRGRELVEHMRTQLPGYAVPRYVQEVPGEPNKRVLM